MKPEALSQLAFFIGHWQIVSTRYKRDPETKKIDLNQKIVDNLTSTVAWVADNSLILETFEGQMGETFYSAASLRAYHKEKALWEQKWVDNQHGGYVDYTGQWHEDVSEFIGYNNHNGQDTDRPWTRERFFDIKENAFSWVGEFSADEGQTWTVYWELDYTRR